MINSPNDYLHQILSNLYELKNAAYLNTTQYYLPESTVPTHDTQFYFKEIIDPTDLKVGAQYVQCLPEDHQKMVFFYNGKVRARTDWELQTFEQELLDQSSWNFPKILAPFYTRVKYLIRYALESPKVVIEKRTSESGAELSLFFPDQMIVIIGRTVNNSIAIPLYQKNQFSKFLIKIDRNWGLPVELRYTGPQMTQIETITDLSINSKDQDEFRICDYKPEGFAGPERYLIEMSRDLTDQQAPDWTLQNASGRQVKSDDFSGKVVLLHFTSLLCGPCRYSKSMINKLVIDFNPGEVAMINIEVGIRNIEAIKEQIGNGVPYLIANDQILNDFNIRSVPVFYLLDRDQVIRKRISGFIAKTTEEQIRFEISRILQR